MTEPKDLDTRPAPSSGASEKTLRVLEAAINYARFTDIVEETKLAKATVHRILGTLVEQKFIAGDSEHGYRPGPRFIGIAGRAISQLDNSALAEPIVDALVREVDCTIHVGVVNGFEMVYVIRKDSSKPYRMASRVGLSMPMHSSGMGKTVLASWPAEEVDRLIAEVGLPARTERTITDPRQLHEELAGIRQRGYALDLGENENGTVCVSAPIRDHLGRVTHGLSISSIALEHPGSSIEQFAPQAIAAADAISQALGYSAP
ncbi:IclR family transcriptional regulator [Arthrobacter gandavensis]|uniref:IclR family transcriptional regulator n=1 Tax=Arthrobacter gandavensis TaxID=169960 RepID=UPI00188DDD6E|nr:IclR family transcriptional regulator [Arthrobacter gandavensis]MBF4992746.1 IclR family transcriptional regulator [Arthrobacter gandavensis]